MRHGASGTGERKFLHLDQVGIGRPFRHRALMLYRAFTLRAGRPRWSPMSQQTKALSHEEWA